ncbi:MAG: C40 family peptidase, partial [Christensenellaceae bacterium]|nr:C40 family peptidase [Christensenellaceae bacterium]
MRYKRNMEPLAISSAVQPYQSPETGSTLAASAAAGGQTFAELFAAQMKDSTLAAVSGVDTAAPADAAESAAPADTAPSYAAPSGYPVRSASGGSNDLMTAMLLMMAGGSFGSSYGMDAAMTSMLSAMQNGGVAGLRSMLGNSGSSATGQAIVQQAMSRLGDPYSKSKRGTGNYVDCSYLVQWAYKQVGINIPGTAAAQAKYCYENGYNISKDELQPGDLIFWTKHSSTAGRWRNIHHVGIYAGNGKIVEAKNNRNGV